MTLSAFDFLCSVVAPIFAFDCCCFYRLRIDTTCARRWFSTGLHANCGTQGVKNLLKRAIFAPRRKILPRCASR